MSPSVPPIPSDYPRVTPALCINGAAKAIEFYQQVLGANERLRIDDPSGRVGHAELTIGDSVIMLSDEYPDMNILGPRSVGGPA
jgi:PhnB protein